jgi:hypothetical protein
VIAALFSVALLCASAVRKDPEPLRLDDDQVRLAAR